MMIEKAVERVELHLLKHLRQGGRQMVNGVHIIREIRQSRTGK
jgi:hypothetical protein